MKIVISQTAQDLGRRAGEEAARRIRAAISERGRARIVLSTGASQFETLDTLVHADVDWARVEMFHLDEYINLPQTHPASFRKYLRERFVQPTGVGGVHFVDGTQENIATLTALLREAPIDVGIVGIGRNGHIAFNDPPADFDTRKSYLVVNLDEACRMQQVAEGWFANMDEVPTQAVSMSPWQIMQCRCILTAVPHEEKAWAIAQTLQNPLTPTVPATLLKTHADFTLYVDANSYAQVGEVVSLRGEYACEDYRA